MIDVDNDVSARVCSQKTRGLHDQNHYIRVPYFLIDYAVIVFAGRGKWRKTTEVPL